jgi:hypothetical protein
LSNGLRCKQGGDAQGNNGRDRLHWGIPPFIQPAE